MLEFLMKGVVEELGSQCLGAACSGVRCNEIVLIEIICYLLLGFGVVWCLLFWS